MTRRVFPLDRRKDARGDEDVSHGVEIDYQDLRADGVEIGAVRAASLSREAGLVAGELPAVDRAGRPGLSISSLHDSRSETASNDQLLDDAEHRFGFQLRHARVPDRTGLVVIAAETRKLVLARVSRVLRRMAPAAEGSPDRIFRPSRAREPPRCASGRNRCSPRESSARTSPPAA